ncbi:GntR family transcriptional regulator [Streptomyces sp. NPDC056653]|uniref:GntR family transcriptional regulator n=1 Tax=Streptomyces sp. NPDC056653 TaxID=3345894 RepID=UPI0036B2F43C
MREALTAAASRRVARPAPLRQAGYDALTELIINGSLEPGQHLVEAELAEHLGISRQPVREALQRLQTNGWVDLRPSQGAFVHSPTQEEAAHLLNVRSVLETYSAQLAAQNAEPETSVAGNDVRTELISLVGQKVRWYYTPMAQPRGTEAWNEHTQLIKAIAKGNADRASEIMRKHTERTTDSYRKQIAAGAGQD